MPVASTGIILTKPVGFAGYVRNPTESSPLCASEVTVWG
jgi:hypothetical protein